jgi:hypothetical protein
MKFAANTASEFMANANKKYGGQSLGETNFKTGVKVGGFKDGSLVKVEFTISITVDFAEPGSGTPDAVNKAVIGEISAATKDHENNHKDSYQDAFDKWDPKQQAKELMGQTFKSKAEADKALALKMKELSAVLLKACLTLHSTEGLIEMKQVITVTSKAAGASGCS